MGTSFSRYLGSSQDDDFRGAMQAMSDGGRFQVPDPRAGIAQRQQAVEKANAWSDRGISAMGGMGDHMNALASQAAENGLSMVASDQIHQANMEAVKAQQAAQNQSGWMGIASQGIGLGLSLLCERRLKTNIHKLDGDNAWRVVRDLPLYGFSYKATPGPAVYGPMIDEVEPLDATLVRPSLLPPDEDGPVRGFDVMRHQAYESLALQQALQRIEGLERDLARLQDGVARLLLESMPALAEVA
jgi:hypothetical protein